MNNNDLREELVWYGNKLIADGLVTGAGGNISARAGDVIYVSPSGFCFADLTPADFVGVDIHSGEVMDGAHKPTSEYLMHLGIYTKRPDVKAVFHTHPRYTVAMSSSGHTIQPMFADFHIYTHSVVPHIDYITVTTPELAEAVAAVADSADAIVLRNHGGVTLGTNCKQAYFRMCTLEEGAHVQWLATLAGTPRFLTPQEQADLDNLQSEKFRRQLLTRNDG